ncbi:hypothetical protein CPC08DRAFT_690092 [Agrocybe pediades]|nr:hypothetical protein CPC08DRAFT_690092 [Agrocybe pediades]
MYSTLNSTTTVETKPGRDDVRGLSRTPSPTPSELKELKTGAIDWKTLASRKFWIRREWLWYYVLLVITLVLVALMTIYHKQIVQWLTPFTKWVHDLKFGWLVPIGILFVISFPPLFGHEIVAVLCGVVWGLWVGFGIVAAGTFLGEVGNFYAFKYCCRARGEKLERTKITYACLARVVRDGGFKIALIARLSAIPGHFTTAVFSTCGMGIIVFSIAAILSMPKQFITVYLGVILENSGTGTEDKKSRIISDTVLAITFLVTVAAMWYILRQMNKVKPQVIYERRKARQAKLLRASESGETPVYMNPGQASTSSVFNPENLNNSDPAIPLTASTYQQWDSNGRAVGYAGDPTLHTPQPRPAHNAGFLQSSGNARYPRDEEEQAGRHFNNARQDSGDPVAWDMSPRPLPSRRMSSQAQPASRPAKLQKPQSQSSQHRVQYEDPYANQTPTQANFAPSLTQHRRQYSSEVDPYGGYAAGPSSEVIYRHGHAQEATDESFRTAHSSSPDQLENPHTIRVVGATSPTSYPGSTNPYPFATHAQGSHSQPSREGAESPRPPSYRTNIR